MKKIIVISDTHGSQKSVDKIYPLMQENDITVHLGDGAGDLRVFMKEEPEKVYLCAGNCDFFSPYPLDGEIEVEGVKIFYCHGHKYQVKSTLALLAQEAKRRGADIALYGHTHKPLITQLNGVTLINPGSMRFPVNEGGSYCYLVVNGRKFTPVLVGDKME